MHCSTPLHPERSPGSSFSAGRFHRLTPRTLRARLLFGMALAVATLAGGAFFSPSSSRAADSEGIAFFEKKIRPVLVQHCYSCHSEEAHAKKKLQASLYLDSQAGTLAGGESGPAIVPGKGAESLLVKALKYDGLEMPPTGRLSDEVVADFTRWIDLGAPDPRQGKAPVAAKREIDLVAGRDFWSFRRLQQVAPPALPASPSAAGWARTPIDQFVLAKLQEKGLSPNGPAAKEKLIRRVYFDLIGLPPTPAQVAAFVEDKSSEAFDKVIDSLLASEQYGERWARHWLDVARYAESGGYEFDGFRPGAYHYRDWVIRALNSDMPYDEFLRTQIAGDKLAPGDYHAASAAGFLVAGPYPGQITAKTVERIRYDQIDDMIMTLGGSMLGLTLGCVRCHEHKYDPFPHQDYYGIAAALARTVHGSTSIDPDPAATQRALDEHAKAQEKLADSLRAYAEKELPGRFEKWRTTELPKKTASTRWQVLDPFSATVGGGNVAAPGGAPAARTITLLEDGLMAGPSGRKDGEPYLIVAQTYQKNVTALRLDAFADRSLPKNGPGLTGDGSFSLADFSVTARPIDPQDKSAPVKLKLAAAHAAFQEKDQPLANAVDDKPNTFWRAKEAGGKDNAAIFAIEGGLPGFAGGTQLSVEMKFVNQGLGRFRLALCVEPGEPTWAGDVGLQHLGEIQAVLAAHKNKLPDSLREPMARWFARFDEPTAKIFKSLADHERARPKPPLADVYTTIGGGGDVYFLRRGEVDNKQGKAEPGFLQVLTTSDTARDRWLPPVEKGRPAVEPRVALARWMTDVDHGAGALVARVMANRLWQHHFGEGIVGTPNDFGAQGDRPTHPELLEWLASQLIEGGWKLKPLHRQIVRSAVYMQSHEASPDREKLDPDNRLLWHHRPRRLEAETIRDALLAVGGSLDPKMYGPSILDATPRRSVYLRVKRSELSPFMSMFDAPEPTQSMGERISTTVPTQALTLMNSPFVRQQAERLASQIRGPANEPLAAAIDRAYRSAFARDPSDAERRRMVDFVEQQQAMVTATDATPAAVEKATQKALAECCQVLLCLNEFVYVD